MDPSAPSPPARPTPVPAPPVALLEQLASRVGGPAGGEPLITYYDLESGERTELSAITFANWVAKTANLLSELAVAEGDVVRLGLTRRSPGHWVTLVWAMAGWTVGATISAARAAGPVAVTVVGPDWSGYETSTATELVACSLHPLGEGFAEALPTGMLDYALEVRGQADRYGGAAPSGEGLAYLDDTRTVSVDELARVGAVEPPQRRLVRPGEVFSTLAAALITPVTTGGSAVIVVGEDSEQVAHIAATEQAV